MLRLTYELADGKLTRSRLADLVGVSGPFLSNVEAGLRRPSPEVLERMAAALGVDDAESLLRDIIVTIPPAPTLAELIKKRKR